MNWFSYNKREKNPFDLCVLQCLRSRYTFAVSGIDYVIYNPKKNT